MCVLATKTDHSGLAQHPSERREYMDRDWGGEGTMGVLSSGGLTFWRRQMDLTKDAWGDQSCVGNLYR